MTPEARSALLKLRQWAAENPMSARHIGLTDTLAMLDAPSTFADGYSAGGEQMRRDMQQRNANLAAVWRNEAVLSRERGQADPGVFKLRRSIGKAISSTLDRCADALTEPLPAPPQGPPPQTEGDTMKLLTKAEYDALSPFEQGYAVYMQAEHAGSELKGMENAYPVGSSKRDQWNNGADRAMQHAQDSEE